MLMTFGGGLLSMENELFSPPIPYGTTEAMSYVTFEDISVIMSDRTLFLTF